MSVTCYSPNAARNRVNSVLKSATSISNAATRLGISSPRRDAAPTAKPPPVALSAVASTRGIPASTCARRTSFCRGGRGNFTTRAPDRRAASSSSPVWISANSGIGRIRSGLPLNPAFVGGPRKNSSTNHANSTSPNGSSLSSVRRYFATRCHHAGKVRHEPPHPAVTSSSV